MDNPDDTEWLAEAELTCVTSGQVSLSPSSSLASSQDLRRMLKPPNKKKYDEEVEVLVKHIRTKENELKALGVRSPDSVAAEMRDLRAEKDATINKRKKTDADLKQLNQELNKKMNSLLTIESNLQYKNEAKIDDAIRRLEWQLKVQNFKVSEERKIVAEVDKLKRTKKVLVQYFAQKKEVDEIRDSQRRMRGAREQYYKAVTNLKNKEDVLKKSNQEKKVKGEELKKEIDELYERKRKLFADFKQSEADYGKMKSDLMLLQKRENLRRREETRKAKEMAFRKELQEYQAQKEPFEDEKNLCNTLVSYLQRYTTNVDDSLTSPREETPPEPPTASVPGPADSLDDGMFVLLKKSEDPDYSITSKRSGRRSRKGRKISVTKQLAHTPQIIAQFASLNLNVPSTMAEVPASLEHLHARKRYYEEHSPAGVPPSNLSMMRLSGSFGSFSSSGSLNLDSPLNEHRSSWSYVEVPPVITENQTPSDAGTSAESGFHDMSRQASKTESSDTQASDAALEEIIRESNADYGESVHSRSSSDTITPEDYSPEHATDHRSASASADQTFDRSVEGSDHCASSNSNTDTHVQGYESADDLTCDTQDNGRSESPDSLSHNNSDSQTEDLLRGDNPGCENTGTSNIRLPDSPSPASPSCSDTQEAEQNCSQSTPSDLTDNDDLTSAESNIDSCDKSNINICDIHVYSPENLCISETVYARESQCANESPNEVRVTENLACESSESNVFDDSDS